MRLRQLQIAGVALYLSALVGVYAGFSRYARNSAEALVDVIVRSEASAIQQGNLLTAVTKLQAAIVASDNLQGVAAFDTGADPSLRLPLIVLGRMPAASESAGWFFARTIVRPVGDQKALVFYFRSSFARSTFLLFALTLTIFSAVVAFLGMRIESVRSAERASTLLKISRQVAHDINSPLSALKITAEMLARKNVPVDLLKSGVARIEEIVADLRADANQHLDLMEATPFSLSEVVAQVLTEKRAEHTLFPITAELEPGLYAVGNPASFKRALSNLVNNAVEASAPGSAIAVDLSRVGKRNRLQVRDVGKGIAPREIKHVFESGASFGKTGGSGLGLHHAREVARRMKGSIKIDSRVNEGTTVTLECPAARL